MEGGVEVCSCASRGGEPCLKHGGSRSRQRLLSEKGSVSNENGARGKVKRTRLDVATKVEIVEKLSQKVPASEIMKEYDIGRRTVGNIRRGIGELSERLKAKGASPMTKTVRSVPMPELEECLMKYVDSMQKTSTSVTGAMIKDVALKYRDELLAGENLGETKTRQLRAFTASDSWVRKLMRRHSIRTMSAEPNAGGANASTSNNPPATTSEIEPITSEALPEFTETNNIQRWAPSTQTGDGREAEQTIEPATDAQMQPNPPTSFPSFSSITLHFTKLEEAALAVECAEAYRHLLKSKEALFEQYSATKQVKKLRF